MTPFVCLSLSMAFWLQGSFAHWLSTSFCKAPWVFTLYILAFLYEMNESSEEGFWIHSLFLCQQNLVTENLSKRCLVSLLYDFLVCLPAQLTRYKFFKEMLFFFFNIWRTESMWTTWHIVRSWRTCKQWLSLPCRLWEPHSDHQACLPTLLSLTHLEYKPIQLCIDYRKFSTNNIKRLKHVIFVKCLCYTLLNEVFISIFFLFLTRFYLVLMYFPLCV